MKAEQDLTDLVTRLKNAAGSNLLSVILYGSAATEEFHEGHSDLNILCIMRSLGRDDLSKLHAASAWWAKKGHPAPLFFTLDELHHSADVFAIELLDIKAAHRILHGEDVMATLHVPMDLHRLHVERELRNNTLALAAALSDASRGLPEDPGTDDLIHFDVCRAVPACLDCSGGGTAANQARHDGPPGIRPGV